MIEVIESKSEAEHLNSAISHYYFMRSDSVNNKFKFIYYPHYNTALNFFLHSEVRIDNSKFNVQHKPNSLSSAIVSCNRTSFKEANLAGKYDIIGIIFKPLGLHHFFNLSKDNPSKHSEYSLPSNTEGLSNLLIKIEQKQYLEDRVKLLDTFFSTLLRPFENVTLIEILDAVVESKGGLRVHELENQFNVPRRTILRWFKKYLYCSITEFKNIVRFRYAIESYNSTQQNLTSISHENNYYDQSDFINHFKALTGELPKQLLERIKEQEVENVFWKFESI